MVQNQSKMARPTNLPELQSVNRITNIPIVETGWNYAEYMYQRIKHSNNLLQWTLDQAESSLFNVLDTASPAVYLIEGPLSTIDKLLCKSLDIVEQKVPSINLPPQMIYSNTKQYVSDVGNKLVRPVLKRADSVKHIGNQVLESKFTAFAADKLDGALNVADMYVDKYLPADVFDKGETLDVVDGLDRSGNHGKAMKTGQHMFRFSNKLRRRLTRRTLLEAKALKDQSAEAIHVLVYVAELIATDPKLALQKGKELWMTLSRDEPENQARPENLEQLIVLLTRETARRVVHLINFSISGIGKVPQRVAVVLNSITSSCLQLLDTLLKTVHLDGVRKLVWHKVSTQTAVVKHLLKQLNMRTTDMLEQLSILMTIEKSETNSAIKTHNSETNAHQAPKVEVPQEGNESVENETNAAAQMAIENITSKDYQEKLDYNQDSLKLPQTGRTQLKATHRNANNVTITATSGNQISNGESILKS